MELIVLVDPQYESVLQLAVREFKMSANELASGALRAFLIEQEKRQVEVRRLHTLYNEVE